MALTISHVDEGKYVEGNKRIRIVDVTFDSSYADNGESLTAADVALTKIIHVTGSVARKSDGSDAVVVSYDHTNSKLLAFMANGAAAGEAALNEVDNATDLSAYSARLKITGR